MTTAAPNLADRFRRILPAGAVVSAPSELIVYECDAFTIEKKAPDLVVCPSSTEDVVKIVKLCNEINLPFVPRGAGTSLAGGCFPATGGVIIALSRLKTIHEINLRDRYAAVGAGVVNLHVSNLLKP